jgi:2-keto-3-deoxy-L-rhamnonate aldolase RhmA
MRKPHRRIRRKLEAREPVIGVTLQLASPDAAEIAGYVGMDYVWVDAEHGTMDLRDINEIVRACDARGIDALVRVPDHGTSFIQRVLDTGAAGIIAPHVRTAAEAAALVAAAKYGPAGTRGACPTTRTLGHLSLDWAADHRSVDADVLVFGLIEDPEGVENVEAIARESGIDGLVFGPFDLSQSLGHEGDVSHADVEELHRRVVAAVRSAGIEYIAIPGWEFDDFATVAGYANIVNVASDRIALASTFATALAETVERFAKAKADATV